MSLKRKDLVSLITAAVLIVGGIVGVLVFWPKSNHTSAELNSASSAIVKKNPDLLFSDEFNGTTLDDSKWVTCYNNYTAKYDGCTNYGNWEGEWYKSSQVSQVDGKLVLSAKRQETQGTNEIGGDQKYPYISGMITSGALDKTSPAKWGNTYGYYEAKMMVPSGQAMWPAFWLLPTDATWPPEIDVMEVLGQTPNKLIQTYFWPDQNGNSAKDSETYTSKAELSDSWHTYGIDWQQGKITWYLDGKQTRSVSSSNVTSKPMHILFNLAVGGTLPGNPTTETPDEAQMLVDYVHVYKNYQASLE